MYDENLVKQALELREHVTTEQAIKWLICIYNEVSTYKSKIDQKEVHYLVSEIHALLNDAEIGFPQHVYDEWDCAARNAAGSGTAYVF